jgi:hypothetical protein
VYRFIKAIKHKNENTERERITTKARSIINENEKNENSSIFVYIFSFIILSEEIRVYFISGPTNSLSTFLFHCHIL